LTVRNAVVAQPVPGTDRHFRGAQSNPVPIRGAGGGSHFLSL